MKGEIWKPVRNYEELYEVSNMGRVKSLERTVWNGKGYYKKPERILKAVDNGLGYLQVQLSKDGRKKWYTIHKLVGQEFLENPMGYTELNHIDEDKANNCVENLEFCSRSYNMTYNGRAKKVAEKKSKPVFSIDKESGLIMWWQSANEASRQLGIRQGHITECCKGKRHTAGNHIWFYADDDE